MPADSLRLVRARSSAGALPLALAFTLFSGACIAPPPVYQERPAGLEEPVVLPQGARAALFTLLVRNGASSNSQGQDWIARRDTADYKRLYDGLRAILQEELQFELVDYDALVAHPLVDQGAFPRRIKNWINPPGLPIVAEKRHVELMLRTASSLRCAYYVTIFQDIGVGKFFLRPARAESELYLQIHSAATGRVVYRTVVEADSVAEPFEARFMNASYLAEYEPVIEAALDRNQAEQLDELRKRLQSEIRLVLPNSEELKGPESGEEPEYEW